LIIDTVMTGSILCIGYVPNAFSEGE